MKRIVEDCIRDKRDDAATIPLRAGLRVLSYGYGFGVAVRNMLYDREILSVRDVPCRVISIGNITVGGTGKTPVTVMTAVMLHDAGYDVAVVSRGYGGSAETVTIVADREGIVSPPDVAGDEPHIIASSLPGVPVVVGRDRVCAAQKACELFRPKAIVLDDGFQHRRLARDIDIITIDAGNPFGNEHLLPRGILREPPRSLKRVSAIVVTHADDESKARVERMIRYYDRKTPLFFSRHVPVGFRNPGASERRGLDWIAGRRVAALSNIAVPGHFHRMIESLGASITMKIAMPDHFKYRADELRKIENDVVSAGVDTIVMTAKDERNIPMDYTMTTIEAAVLDIEASLTGDRDKYLELICPKR